MIKINLLILLFISASAGAQPGYKTGDVVKDFPVNKILNYSSPSAPLSQLKGPITIIDFFGTWCVPCIKALPHLSALQQQYKNSLNIILVSNEEEAKLKKFITSRNNFSFPLVVDAEDVFTNLFQPPSYPYTVVLNKEGKVLSILTDAASIDEAAIAGWLANKTDVASFAGQKEVAQNQSKGIMNNRIKSSNAVVQLSQDFMYAAKTGYDVSSFTERFRTIPYHRLQQALVTDKDKKAFWINLYNAYTQTALKKDPDKYKNRKKFFTDRDIVIAGKNFSLDDIEHGFLRHSKVKWSLGYIGKLFPGKTEKELRVAVLDPRLHFALNCGAKSCPPIAFYGPENIDQQLDMATKAYLSGEAEWNAESNALKLPAIMGWFRHDFGGKKGMTALVKKHGLIPADAFPKIRFKPYDWSLYLSNYKTETEP